MADPMAPKDRRPTGPESDEERKAREAAERQAAAKREAKKQAAKASTTKDSGDAADPGAPGGGPKKQGKQTKASRGDTAGVKPREPGSDEALVHSSQLDERLRHADPVATPKDKRNVVLLNLLVVVSFLLLIAVVVGHVGNDPAFEAIGFALSIEQETYVLALATVALAGCSYLFASIRWRAIRGPTGSKVLSKAKTDLMLTIVSVAALFTVIMMVIVEILALVVFLGLVDFGDAAVRFASNFALFQTIMLLVYVMAVVARQNNASSFHPTPKALMAAKILTPVALVIVAVGVLMATGFPQQRLGVGQAIETRQAVYIVTLGVLLEFMAMRIRLSLPSLLNRFMEAVDASRLADEAARIQLRRKATRTYLFALLFVAGSMAFAGAVATNSLNVASTRVTLALVIFYVGASLIAIGMIAVRILQQKNLERSKTLAEGEDPMETLLAGKRMSPQQVLRISVYTVTGFLAAAALVAAIVVGSGQFSDVQQEEVPIFKDNGQPEIDRTTGDQVVEFEDVEKGIHPKFSTDLALLALLFAAGPFGFFYTREMKRTEAIDEKFPDFLRDIAESARAGMTLPRALVTASQGSYGALTPDIRMMAAQVEWGIDFKESLERFAERTKTNLIDRTVSLVVEAQRAGGNVVDILTAASDDAREIKQIVSERNEQMSMYKVVVFIAFFVFIAVVLILSAQFIPAFKEAVGAASGQEVGGLKFREFDPEDFNTLFMHAAIIQAIGGGLVGGVLTRGNPVAGFSAIAVMIVIAWFSFRVLVGLMGA